MKALYKDFFRGLRKNKGKFISVFFIILLGAAFFSGLRSSQTDMLLSAEKYYDDAMLMDFRIVGTAGLTEEDLQDIQALDGIAEAEGGYTLDVLCNSEDKKAVRLISCTEKINLATVLEGRLPEKDNECFLDSLLLELGEYHVGDTIEFVSGNSENLQDQLVYTEYTICGFGDLPYYMDLNRGTGNVGNGELDGFVLLKPQAFRMSVYTEIYANAEGARALNSFEEEYEALAAAVSEELETLSEKACERRYEELLEQFGGAIPGISDLIRMPQWYVLGRESIASCVNFENDAERIASLGKLLPIIFFLVAALVSLTAMTRMVEEERQQIGTLKALGSGNAAVLARYLMYALLPTLTGSIVGVLIGEKIFPLAIMKTYALLYKGLNVFLLPYNLPEGGIAVAASVLCTGLATLFACYNVVREKPAQIMRPEAPKPGKRVLLERVGFLWKRFSFTQKSTIRNMFRYKKRFLMTVIGVAGCMGLVLVGLGLHDSIMVVVDKQFEELTHYQASVVVAETVTEEQADSLIEDIEQTEEGITAFLGYQKSVDVQGKNAAQSVAVNVPREISDISEYFTFRERLTKKSLEITEEGAILSEKTAKMLGVTVGDTVSFRDGDSDLAEVKITGIYENYIGHYLFMSAEQYRELFGKDPSYNQILLKYEDTSDDFQDKIGNYLLNRSEVQAVTFVSATVDWADDTLSSLNTIVLIVLGAAALLAFVVLYNLNSINIAERKRELATLKVLGFYDTEVASYVYKENVLLTVIGVIFGIGLGILLHQYVIASIEVDLIMFGRSISWISYLLGSVITLAFSAIINLVMYKSLCRIDMIESLKSIE